MTTAPASATTSPTTATTMCHIGRLHVSSSSTVPMRIPTTGLTVDTVATDGARRPVPSDTCCSTNPRMPATASTYGCQFDSIVADAVAEEGERRLGERRRQAEQHARHRAVDGGACARVGAVPSAEVEQTRRHDRDQPDHDRPLEVRCVLVPAGRVGEHGEEREPGHDHGRADDLPRADVLVGQPVAERQREHDRGDEQWLDDRQATLVECDRLDHVTAQQRDGSQQPHRLADQLQQRGRVGERHLRKVSAPFCCRVAATAKRKAANSASAASIRRDATRGRLGQCGISARTPGGCQAADGQSRDHTDVPDRLRTVPGSNRLQMNAIRSRCSSTSSRIVGVRVVEVFVEEVVVIVRVVVELQLGGFAEQVDHPPSNRWSSIKSRRSVVVTCGSSTTIAVVVARWLARPAKPRSHPQSGQSHCVTVAVTSSPVDGVGVVAGRAALQFGGCDEYPHDVPLSVGWTSA